MKLDLANRRIVPAAAVALVLILAAAGSAQDSGGITGFAPSRVAAERQLEQKLRAIPDAARAEANLRHLTSEPHMAGTEASRRVAEWLRDQYRSFGFDAEIVTYSVWLPHAARDQAGVDQARTENSRLLPKQPFDVDKDTSDKRIVPAFNRYSPSGEVTAPVVYVNYGMPDDYRELASRRRPASKAKSSSPATAKAIAASKPSSPKSTKPRP